MMMDRGQLAFLCTSVRILNNVFSAVGIVNQNVWLRLILQCIVHSGV